MDDAAILAHLEREPDAFAELYRRHTGRLLEYLDGRTYDRHAAADVCAETFAVALAEAHRFDPGAGDVAAWLDGIARRLLARAQHRGRVDDRARRRLGMASLEPGEPFAGELEEELVAASRFPRVAAAAVAPTAAPAVRPRSTPCAGRRRGARARGRRRRAGAPRRRRPAAPADGGVRAPRVALAAGGLGERRH